MRGYPPPATAAAPTRRSAHLQERTRPAMAEHQRQGCRAGTWLMDKMNALLADSRLIVRQLIEPRLLRRPIECGRPIAEQVAQHIEVHALAPALPRQGPRQTRARQTLAQVIQIGLGEIQSDRFDKHGSAALGDQCPLPLPIKAPISSAHNLLQRAGCATGEQLHSPVWLAANRSSTTVPRTSPHHPSPDSPRSRPGRARSTAPSASASH